MTSHESDGFTSEEGKRKRDEEASDLSKRSKKTARTPPKKNEDKLDNLTAMMQQVMLELHEIRKNQKDYQTEMTKIKQENAELKEENKKLKTEVGQLKTAVQQIDRENRKNNIVLNGLDIKDGDIEKNINEIIKNCLELDITVKEAIRLGPMIYKAKLNNWKEKDAIMKNKNKLKNYGNGRVYINNELTKWEMEIQGHLRNVAMEEKSKGKK